MILIDFSKYPQSPGVYLMYGDNDIVSQLVNNELTQIENFASKDVIDVETDE